MGPEFEPLCCVLLESVNLLGLGAPIDREARRILAVLPQRRAPRGSRAPHATLPRRAESALGSCKVRRGRRLAARNAGPGSARRAVAARCRPKRALRPPKGLDGRGLTIALRRLQRRASVGGARVLESLELRAAQAGAPPRRRPPRRLQTCPPVGTEAVAAAAISRVASGFRRAWQIACRDDEARRPQPLQSLPEQRQLLLVGEHRREDAEGEDGADDGGRLEEDLSLRREIAERAVRPRSERMGHGRFQRRCALDGRSKASRRVGSGYGPTANCDEL